MPNNKLCFFHELYYQGEMIMFIIFSKNVNYKATFQVLSTNFLSFYNRIIVFGTYVKGCKTVPTEDMFTSFTHHLCTAIISFNRNTTYRASLDLCLLRALKWNSTTHREGFIENKSFMFHVYSYKLSCS